MTFRKPLIKDNSLDRYTSADDELRRVNEQLSQLNNNQQQTNQLLKGLLGKEFSVGSISLPELSTITVEKEKYKTFVVRLNNMTGTNFVLYDERFEGMLADMYLISAVGVAANGVYRIKIYADDERVFDDLRSTLAISSNYEADMSAYSDVTYFATTFQNIAFTNKIHIEISESTATFAAIYMKFHRRIDPLKSER